MNKQQVDDLRKSFREIHGQVQVCPTPKELAENKRKNATSENYSKFLKKYQNLENTYEKFTTRDLCYFFREKSIESGNKYIISNMKRDMGIFKRIKANFEIAEILLMIEFLFSEEQDYLDCPQPTILTSNWVNTIYKDSLLWANGEYVPHKDRNPKRKLITNREWKKSSEETKSKIGEWE